MRKLFVVCALFIAATGWTIDSSTTPSRVGPPEEYTPYSWDLGASRAILWDNGDTDGSNGYSHGVAAAIGARRALLDDFVIPSGDVAWDVNNLTWLLLWNTLVVPSATGAEISFRNDTGGSPAATYLATASIGAFAETSTGRTWFGRPEMQMSVDFAAVNLVEGTYWVDYLVVGPENAFAMVKATITGSECWADWDDLGFGTASSVIGTTPADLSFVLSGDIVPVELQSFSAE
jgi:hypothetical protein